MYKHVTIKELKYIGDNRHKTAKEIADELGVKVARVEYVTKVWNKRNKPKFRKNYNPDSKTSNIYYQPKKGGKSSITDEQEKYIRANAKAMTSRQMAENLGIKNWRNVASFVSSRKLKR